MRVRVADNISKMEAKGISGGKVDPIASIVLSTGVSIASHPIVYTKTLIQLGYEPLQAVPSTSIFGRKVMVYPNVFKYLGHIKSQDGFLGLYRGLGARLLSSIVHTTVNQKMTAHMKEHHLHSGVDEDEVDGTELSDFKFMCKETALEMVCRFGGTIASQPFHVIMVRSMAQFVGHETAYDNIFSGIKEIYQQEGIMGFFAGLIPRLVSDALNIWLVNLLVFLIDKHIVPPEQGPKGLKSYSHAVCTMLVTQLTYPFQLCGTLLAVNGSNLAAASISDMPKYTSLADCLTKLRAEGQSKRGSSLFWRYYKGPVPKTS